MKRILRFACIAQPGSGRGAAALAVTKTVPSKRRQLWRSESVVQSCQERLSSRIHAFAGHMSRLANDYVPGVNVTVIVSL